MDSLTNVMSDVAKHHPLPPAEVHQHISGFGHNM